MADPGRSSAVSDLGRARPDAMISVRGLCKGFTTSTTRVEILKDVDFDVQAAETVSIVGASGIGKSTFLHIIGTLEPSRPRFVLVRGRGYFQLRFSPAGKISQ